MADRLFSQQLLTVKSVQVIIFTHWCHFYSLSCDSSSPVVMFVLRLSSSFLFVRKDVCGSYSNIKFIILMAALSILGTLSNCESCVAAWSRTMWNSVLSVQCSRSVHLESKHIHPANVFLNKIQVLLFTVSKDVRSPCGWLKLRIPQKTHNLNITYSHIVLPMICLFIFHLSGSFLWFFQCKFMSNLLYLC